MGKEKPLENNVIDAIEAFLKFARMLEKKSE